MYSKYIKPKQGSITGSLLQYNFFFIYRLNLCQVVLCFVVYFCFVFCLFVFLFVCFFVCLLLFFLVFFFFFFFWGGGGGVQTYTDYQFLQQLHTWAFILGQIVSIPDLCPFSYLLDIPITRSLLPFNIYFKNP